MTKKRAWGQDSSTARDYVRDRYLRAAVQSGRRSFRVVVGEVHSALGFHNRVPLVCNALTSKKFLRENALRIVDKSGPPSGQSTTVAITYEILDGGQHQAVDPLMALRGVGKQVFEALGGGEAFLKAERAAWSGGNER